ncbi:MarR family winged helix-turn-helix transcriptional regulator [Nocardioides antri]|uniref:MarR family transcriptional regulator n=1 Tax=Nocardioides antri TaxID=2607659 RepID=A0A5B1M1S1_9ACTN|nr:MarR family transcriptional regulator [Nocardioides antri]KAA1426596.1 MarR family transcriptional regulator [Nocardioides antri]
MAGHPQLHLDAQLCFPLYAATRAVTRAYGPLLRDHGLTYPQYLTLLALWDGGDPMSVGDLGSRLRLDSGTLTPLLKRLEQAGFVARRRDPDDERRVLIAVTAAGWELRDQVSDVPSRLVESLGLNATESRQLRRLLDSLLDRLDAELTETTAH